MLRLDKILILILSFEGKGSNFRILIVEIINLYN